MMGLPWRLRLRFERNALAAARFSVGGVDTPPAA
jgi:hypothetical protein